MSWQQKDVIDIICSIISSWKSTNDINSPTIYLDITEELKKLEYDEIPVESINDLIYQLFAEIKNIK